MHRAKKSLGQHFLRSQSAIRAIVSSGNVSATDTVLEIGPGEGVLTKALLATGAHVVAVEFDHALIPILSERFSTELASGQLALIEKDILKFDPSSISPDAPVGTPTLRRGYKLIANIPYYITGAIFEKFLTEKNPPSLLVVLIQKEVATRIVARDRKESILSISVKAFGSPKITMKVPASAFRPAPKVDSAVLLVDNISQDKFKNAPPRREYASPLLSKGGEVNAMEHFFKIVRAGFAHKRKLLVRNLEAVADKTEIARAFAESQIPANARAEDVALEIWFALARTL